MKFGSESVKQGSDFGAEGVLRPRDELTPMIFGVFPQDFDHVEFWTVWRQIDQGGIVHGEPAGGDFVVKPMMDFGVIKNDEGGLGRGDVEKHVVNEGDKGWALDGANGLLMDELRVSEIQSAHDRHALMVLGRGQVGLTQGRPGPLNGRRRGKPGFVVVDQLTFPLPGLDLEFGKFGCTGGKFVRVAFFLRDHRVRLKLKPCALSAFPKVSNEHGKAH